MRVELGIERALDGPVVRQPHLPPLRVLEGGLLRAGRIPFEETPSVVEGQSALVPDLDRGRHGRRGEGE